MGGASWYKAWGSVGEGLLALLEKENATLLITDIDAARLRAMEKKFRVEVVPTEGSMYRDIDIFVPCALGGILHEESISQASLSCGGRGGE